MIEILFRKAKEKIFCEKRKKSLKNANFDHPLLGSGIPDSRKSGPGSTSNPLNHRPKLEKAQHNKKKVLFLKTQSNQPRRTTHMS